MPTGLVAMAVPAPMLVRVRRILALLAVILATVACRAAAVEAPRPLAGDLAGEQTADIVTALIALARGDPGPLEALPSHLFRTPIPWPERGGGAVSRRWTTVLPEALAGLAGAQRERALAALERCYLASIAGVSDPEQRARIAIDFLPAPAAVAALRASADRAFDLGRFRHYLALDRLLAGAGARAPAPAGAATDREGIADLLLGRGARVDPALAIPAPGETIPTAAKPLADSEGITVDWRVADGHLLACDPWGGVLWQLPLEHRAELHAGPAGAVLQDSRGLRLVREDGTQAPLPPPPPGSRILCVAGGAAWFATGATVYRLDFADQRVTAIVLPEPPLAPPVVRGRQSLWLTRRELLLYADAAQVHRLRHGLPAASGWTLGTDSSQILVVEEGRSHRIQPLEQQLQSQDPLVRARVLLRAMRHAEALAELATQVPSTPAGRALALRAHLGLGPAHVAEQGEALIALADDGAAAFTARLALDAALAGRATAPDAEANRAALAEAARAVPDAQAPQGDDAAALWRAFAVPTDEWDAVITGAGWLARDALRPPRIELRDARRPLGEPRPLAAPPEPERSERRPDGTHAYRGRSYRLESAGEWTTVACLDGGRLLWRRRWVSPPLLSAPARALAIHHGQVLVAEGDAALAVFSASDGHGHGWFTTRDVTLHPGQATWLSAPGVLAVLTPPGIDDRLALVDEAGVTAVTVLGAQARWLLPVGGRALVLLTDGRARWYPGGEPADLPADLLRAPLPVPTAEGLAVGDRLYPWN